MNTRVSNGHCENFANCVLMGANNGNASGEQAIAIEGSSVSKPQQNAVQISGNYPTNGNFVIQNVTRQGDTNAIQDSLSGVTITDNFVSNYAYGMKSSSYGTIMDCE